MKIEKIVVASHNQGKIKEIGEMLKPLNIAVVSAAELELPDVEETGTTFEENARLKADAFSKLCGLPCLADDSGLCVDALGGRPGVYSARYAPNRDFDKGMEMLLGELAAAADKARKAHFSCVLAFAFPGMETKVFEGRSTAGLQPKNTETAVSAMIPCLYPTRATAGVSGSSAKRKKTRFRTGAEPLRSFWTI